MGRVIGLVDIIVVLLSLWFAVQIVLYMKHRYFNNGRKK